ncbi:MAG TPA: glycerate kinase [Mycobacteriales bacterium]|jgi:glycerate kinase|nr:glycerate kinase [Mycobacteriales bacterium]
MRVLVAPDSFGGTLTAAEAGAAIADGWRRRRPDDRVTVLPVGDGGHGTLDALRALGEVRATAVEDALGRRVDAEWLLLPGGTAFVESAAACGLHLLAPEERDPLAATTAGVGDLVCAALGAGVRRVVVGVGGTATVDGGAGCAQALGAWLLDAAGHPLPPGGAALARLDRVTLDDLDPRLRDVEVVVAADVDNALLGADGAAYGYGPQKGADAAAVAALDAALARWAEVLDRDVPGAAGVAARPHAGAGGGLAAGLMAVCGARAEPGAGVVLGLLGVARQVAKADLVVTGEGAFDWQSLRGKAPGAVARTAAAEGLPCVVVAGQVSGGRRELAAAGVDAAYAAADLAGSVEESMAAPGEWLAELAAHVAGEWSR